MARGLLQAFLGLGGLCRHLGAGQGMAVPSEKGNHIQSPEQAGSSQTLWAALGPERAT